MERARRERDGEPVSVAAEERLDLVELFVGRIALDAEAGDTVELDVRNARRREADGSATRATGSPAADIIDANASASARSSSAITRGVAARFSAQRARPRYDCQSGIACVNVSASSPGVGQLRERVLDELLLGRAAFDRLRPVEQAEAQFVEMPRHVFRDAEMDQREPLGSAAADLVERRLPGLDVGVGRRRRRHDRAAGQDAHAARVAGVERAVGVEVADVVRRVTGRGEGVEADDGAIERVDVLLGHRRELAPERVERVAVQPACAPLQSFRARRGAARRSERRAPAGRGACARARPRRPRGRGGCA